MQRVMNRIWLYICICILFRITLLNISERGERNSCVIPSLLIFHSVLFFFLFPSIAFSYTGFLLIIIIFIQFLVRIEFQTFESFLLLLCFIPLLSFPSIRFNYFVYVLEKIRFELTMGIFPRISFVYRLFIHLVPVSKLWIHWSNSYWGKRLEGM